MTYVWILLKKAGKRYVRPGKVSVRIGQPVRYDPDKDPAEIAKDLESRIAAL